MNWLDDMMTWSLWVFLPPLYFVGTAAGLWVVVAGNSPPASCIFSQVMNLAAFAGFIIAVLRYLQIKYTIGKSWLNIGSVIACSVSCFGMTLVGNFQIFSEETIHNTGTLMVFGMGTLFCWMQSFMTLCEGKKFAVFRFLLSASITACIIIHSSMIAVHLHMHGARSQWALVMFLLMFIATFAVEFRHCHFDLICRDDSRCSIIPPQTFSEMRQTHDWSNTNT
ncbi:transmembrane protein 150C isoform X2 [Thalassophryne amazonica]|uniref:transmembrane protein 150C isoform X2 n=1 Tax=Thalassophryne amazonica TaxID=390379 RepID=UPI0014718C79|nr:transmembrane protein 150C isoform X2 [Thalassophryne amazonica]